MLPYRNLLTLVSKRWSVDSLGRGESTKILKNGFRKSGSYKTDYVAFLWFILSEAHHFIRRSPKTIFSGSRGTSTRNLFQNISCRTSCYLEKNKFLWFDRCSFFFCVFFSLTSTLSNFFLLTENTILNFNSFAYPPTFYLF